MMSDWLERASPRSTAYLEGRRLDEVRMLIISLIFPAFARGKQCPPTKFAASEYFHLPTGIFYQTITAEWGDAAGVDGFIEKRRFDPAPRISRTATAAPAGGLDLAKSFHGRLLDRGWTTLSAIRHANVLKRVVGAVIARKAGNPLWPPRWNFFLVARQP